MAGKTAAKAEQKAAVRLPSLTSKVCAHCGERLMSNNIRAVRETVIGANGHGRTRMVVYAKSH
jgi:hypothetical protein